MFPRKAKGCLAYRVSYLLLLSMQALRLWVREGPVRTANNRASLTMNGAGMFFNYDI